jgi:hypothetical protein
MNEQPSIFDEQFNVDVPVRRRQLLSPVLKVYIWIGMIVSGFLGLSVASTVFLNIYSFSERRFAAEGWGPVIVGCITGSIIVAALFLMAFLVWKEVRWAIRFNWVVAALWTAFVASGVAISGTAILMLAAPSLILVPYWILLFRIQRKWEQ